MLKLPTYKEIKNLSDPELKELCLQMKLVPFEDTDDTFINKFQAVASELIKRDLAYFDNVDRLHFI